MMITEAANPTTTLSPFLESDRIPRHIAIIPDGNRRWAKQQGNPYSLGHQAGANALIEIVKAAKRIGVKTVTFYLFSTENWSRTSAEIASLMWLLKSFLKRHVGEMQKEGVRLQTIGMMKQFPRDVQDAVAKAVQQTAQGEHIDMVMALNYGGRDDIVRAVRKIVDKSIKEGLQPEEIDESLIASQLDTHPWGDPDLLIRTSGEKRISNFLLWQISYAELYVTDTLWPDFTPKHLHMAIADFQMRERRLGGK